MAVHSGVMEQVEDQGIGALMCWQESNPAGDQVRAALA
jgi:hypothetical protein